VRAVDGRIHGQRERHGGRGRGGHTAAETVSDCGSTVGELIVRDQVLIEARRSMQCVVRGFLETSAHKSHRYISRYPEIFEKKSRLVVQKIR